MISAKLVAEYLEYKDGHLWWVKRPPGPTKNIIGNRFGSVGKLGYISGQLLGKIYKEHRLIWLLNTGKWPADQLDHTNGVRDDNRIENLRECTNQQNSCNRPGWEGASSSYKGVSWHKGKQKWVARCMSKGKMYNLGSFSNESDAVKAYQECSNKLHKEFAKEIL